MKNYMNLFIDGSQSLKEIYDEAEEKRKAIEQSKAQEKAQAKAEAVEKMKAKRKEKGKGKGKNRFGL